MSDQTLETDGGEGSESPVLADVRKQLRNAEKELKELKEQNDELAAQVTKTREGQARQFVDAAGLKELDISIVLDRVEGEITAESVNAALAAAGIKPQTGEAGASKAGGSDTGKAPAGSVSELGQRVANAASGSPTKSVEERLAAATSAEEVNAIMAEIGGTRSYA